MGMFNNFYRDKNVVVTGHTGFKGSWLCKWLLSLGANVSGISIGIPTNPSLFKTIGLENEINHHISDVTDPSSLKKLLDDIRPDVIFHLAAQAIVSTSYEDPLGTILSNSLGTANVCDYLKGCQQDVTCVLITSDKCYENVEWEYGYRENDVLGGKDIYSASKACAEILYASYFNSFLREKTNVRVCTARAGNVIGGGDWAKDRIVVDMFNSWSDGKSVKIRSPLSTRPWQHVLEPLSGYLHLGVMLNQQVSINGQSFNFGPKSEQNRTVIDLANDLFDRLKDKVSAEIPYEVVDNKPFHEAGLLKLCCDKASMYLRWQANLDYDQCVDFIGDWYRAYLTNEDMDKVTSNQIERYSVLALEANLTWTK
mgnify:CR=1 FL=1